MRHDQETTGFHYQEPERLTEAIEQQQAASSTAGHGQGVLDKVQARNTRRYYEGLVKLSALKVLHQNLIAPSWHRAGQNVSTSFKSDHEARTQTVATEPANRLKSSAEITLIEKGRNRAQVEYQAHHAKAEAFGLLGDRYRELSSDRLAHEYHERARLESASARGFDTVIKAYDKKIEDLGDTRLTQESPDSRTSFRSLEQADRYLEDYNSGYAKVCNHTRRLLANERTIQRLEAACASRPQSAVEHKLLKDAVDHGEKLKSLAETEAFNAVASYRNFQKEIESAEKAYDVLSRILTGNPAELASASVQGENSGNKDRLQTPLESDRDLEDPPCPVAETTISNKSTEEPELDKPEVQVSGSDLNHPKPSGHRQSRAIVAAVITQTLKEMDREL